MNANVGDKVKLLHAIFASSFSRLVYVYPYQVLFYFIPLSVQVRIVLLEHVNLHICSEDSGEFAELDCRLR